MPKPNPSIKFSHIYKKFMDGWKKVSGEATLLQVLPVNLINLSKEFIEYDTAIYGGGHYPLPKSGEYLMLIFHGANGLFTTLRPAHSKGQPTGTKQMYYDMLVGKTFNIIVDPPKINIERLKPEHID